MDATSAYGISRTLSITGEATARSGATNAEPSAADPVYAIRTCTTNCPRRTSGSASTGGNRSNATDDDISSGTVVTHVRYAANTSAATSPAKNNPPPYSLATGTRS